MNEADVPKRWTASAMPSQSGKRILITGANSGIGYCAAVKLARRGASVVLACRDQKKGEIALSTLQNEAPGTDAEMIVLDLASLESVRQFAADERARNRPLHVLINNAGVMAPRKRQETAEGFELQFGTNVLGHFALTGLLMPAFKSTAARSAEIPRIITVASIAHKRGKLDFDDLQSKTNYSPMRAYQQSKLANLMLTLELDRRLRASSLPFLSIAVHPGVANTNLFQSGQYSAAENAFRRILGHGIDLLLNTDTEGALPTLYAATDREAHGGGYYGPQGFQEMRGEEVGPARIAPHARDASAAAKLWAICEDLTGVRFP